MRLPNLKEMDFRIAFRKIYHGVLMTFRQLKRNERNIKVFIVYGLLYDLFLNLYKPFSVKFLYRLGGDSFHVGLLNSLPGIMAVFALIPGSVFISRFKVKKPIISIFFALSRTFVLLIAFIPFVPESARPVLFVVLLSAMNFPDSISQSGLQGFLGDVFDGFSRSKAITLRNKFGQIVAPVVTLVTGLIITTIPKNEAQTVIAYQIFFILAFIAGMFEVFTFMKFDEKNKPTITSDANSAISPAEKPEKKPGFRDALATLKDRRFVLYLIPTLFFYFMYQSGWPLFSILSVEILGATELHLAFSAVCSGITGFFSANFWSRKISKKGNDYVTVLMVVHLALTIFTSAVSPNIYFYIAMQIYGGFVGIGIVITLLNGLLAATPEKNRVIYISVYNTFINISLGVSPFFAIFLNNALDTRPAMFIVGFGRLLSGFVLYCFFRKYKGNSASKTTN